MKEQLYKIRQEQINNALKEKEEHVIIQESNPKEINESQEEQVEEIKQKKSGLKKILSLFRK